MERSLQHSLSISGEILLRAHLWDHSAFGLLKLEDQLLDLTLTTLGSLSCRIFLTTESTLASVTTSSGSFPVDRTSIELLSSAELCPDLIKSAFFISTSSPLFLRSEASFDWPVFFACSFRSFRITQWPSLSASW